jgi:hypothetical protein
MRPSSREVVFINTALPDERLRLLKSIDHIQQLEDESEDIDPGGLIKRYTKRPSCLENVTLADWAAWYDNRKSNLKNLQKCKNIDVDGLPLEIYDDDNNEDDDISADITCSNELTCSRKNRIYSQTPTIEIKSDPPALLNFVLDSLNRKITRAISKDN